MPDRCILCGWLLDGDHPFNIHCAAANAENDQLEAEVREAQSQPLDEGELALLTRAVERAWDTLALRKFYKTMGDL